MSGVAPRPAAERFWVKVDQTNGPNACWLWTGHCATNGYGRFCPEPRKKKRRNDAYTSLRPYAGQKKPVPCRGRVVLRNYATRVAPTQFPSPVGVAHQGGPGPSVAAHRFAYEALVGPIPAGLQLDHLCRVKNCVNPAHLRPVTNKQNHENALVRRDNTSGVRGVSLNRHTGKWWAYADHHGKRHSAGLFADKADAEAAVIALRNRLFTHNDADRT